MAWSLYERKEEDVGEGAGLFNYTGEKLEPLTFSNGKTQEDVVQEAVDAIGKGHKIIFIKGACGSGKSAIALNIARYFTKSSIVVPIKSLQEQYERDYTQKKFVTKEDGTPLKISVIKGRNNFPCNFDGGKADRDDLACTIEIRDKNTEALLKFIEMNPEAKVEDFSSASDIRRANVAAACPYWAPIMPAEVNPKNIGPFSKKKYMALSGKEFAVFTRKRGCPYYEQYNSYADSDVLIFNSMKYLIETTIGRKPQTDVEIIDECDEFLDNFTNERRINLNRLHLSLSRLTPFESDKKEAVRDLIRLVNDVLLSSETISIEKIKDSSLIHLFETILEHPNLAEEEELSYYNTAVEIIRSFEHVINETYVAMDRIEKKDDQKGLFGDFSGGEDTVIVNLVSINLAQKFHEIVEANNALVLMSGTIHSEEVLRDIFGLDNFVIIDAETKSPGEIKKEWTGLERNCSFSNFTNGTIDRKTYLKIMDLCLANAKTPTLVHVNAFKDLPTEEENKIYKFDNLITQEKLRELQSLGNGPIQDFYNGVSPVLFTTKCSRGVDFPGDKCNSIVITRFPYPNIQGLFWKILKKEQPEKFMEFYVDKAKRELFQKISRGVRFRGDVVSLWSPDVRVVNETFN